MPWFVRDIETVCEYVCLCDPAVDRKAMTPEQVHSYERSPSPASLPLLDGMEPHTFRVHAISTDEVVRLRSEMIAAVGPAPPDEDPDLDAKQAARAGRSLIAAWNHDVSIVKAGLVDCPDSLSNWPESVVEELAGVIRSLSSGDTVLRGN